MTEQEIDTLPAGSELDSLVATQVMGWKLEHQMEWPLFSQDIRAAWEVIEVIRSDMAVSIMTTRAARSSQWQCAIYQFHETNPYIGQKWYAVGETISLAICRAALKTLISEKER